MNKKVVVFGGGTGISYLLRGLNLFPVDIIAVVTVSDDGASTGKLREEFSMPGMGDIRKAIVSLSDAPPEIKDLLSYRFNTYSDLDGHPIGNLILTAMYNMTGSLSSSIKVLSDFLDVKHKVLPLSEDYLTLMAETVDGKIVSGEKNIPDVEHRYKRFFYKEVPHVSKEVIDAIKSADLIVFSMGSLYTSIIPHLIADEVVNAIDMSKARILYTCNAVIQKGETDDYTVGDHVAILNSYLGKKKVDAVLVSSTVIPKKIIDRYVRYENKELVKFDPLYLDKLNCEVISSDLLTIENNYIRHDSLKLATAIFNYLMRWFYVFCHRG